MLNRIFQSFLILLTSNFILADYTATLNFVDSTGTAIDRYLGYWDDIYIEIYDEDLSGEVDVFLSSDTDTDGETVTLSEIEDFRFRGSIPVELLEYEAIIADEDDLQREIIERIKQITPEHSDWDEQRILDEATSKVRAEHMKRTAEDYINYPVTRDDGLIQLKAGDTLYASYTDQTNDYGEEEELNAEVLYGVWSGLVIQNDTHWTMDDSPVIVTGDLIFYGGTLTISEGVEVLVRGNYLFGMYGGTLDINGSEDNKVIFRPEDLDNAEPGVWQGIRGDNGYIPGTNTWVYNTDFFIDHAQILYGAHGIYHYMSDDSDSFEVSNSEIAYSSSHGLYSRYQSWGATVSMYNVSSHDNGGMGFYHYSSYYSDSMDIHSCSFNDNDQSGMYLDYVRETSINVNDSEFNGNGNHGAEIYPGQQSQSRNYVVDNSQFLGNDSYGLILRNIDQNSDMRSTINIELTNLVSADNGSIGIEVHNIGTTSQWSSGNWNLTFDNNQVYNNGSFGLWFWNLWQNQNAGQSSMTITNNQIYDNDDNEFKIGYITSLGENASITTQIENNDFIDDEGYLVVMDGNLEEDRLGEEITMRNNYWGELATAEMNEGDNPKDISQFYDYYDDNNRHMINYSNWEPNSVFDVDGCMDESACNYDESATVDDDSCLYDDCFGECGGEAVLDDCGICDGPGNSDTWYVDENGSSDNCGSEDNPLNSIQDAIDLAENGDVIYVLGGSYILSETIAINKSLNLMCFDEGQCLITADQIGRGISITASDINVIGFDISGSDLTEIGILISSNADNIIIANNRIYGMALPHSDIDPFSYGILVFGQSTEDMPTNLTFSNNEIWDVTGGAIVLGQYTDSVSVIGNYIHDLNPVDFLGFPVSYGVGAELSLNLIVTNNTFENLYIASNILTSQASIESNIYDSGINFLLLSALSECEFDESIFWYKVQYTINYNDTDFVGDLYVDNFETAIEYADAGSTIIDSDSNEYLQNCFGEWTESSELDGTQGDINQDGGLNVLDIVEIIIYIFEDNDFDECEFNIADISGDNNINVLDIIIIVSLIMGENSGCTDLEACNYDEDALFDDESCQYFDDCGQCGGNEIDEPFIDQNNNGIWDNEEPTWEDYNIDFLDDNGNGVWDEGEWFNDVDESGTWDTAEPYDDLNGNGEYDNCD